MVRREPWSDVVEPVRVSGCAVHAQHRSTSGNAVVQVMKLDAVGVDEVAGAGCRVQFGHGYCPLVVWRNGQFYSDRPTARCRTDPGSVSRSLSALARSAFG